MQAGPGGPAREAGPRPARRAWSGRRGGGHGERARRRRRTPRQPVDGGAPLSGANQMSPPGPQHPRPIGHPPRPPARAAGSLEQTAHLDRSTTPQSDHPPRRRGPCPRVARRRTGQPAALTAAPNRRPTLAPATNATASALARATDRGRPRSPPGRLHYRHPDARSAASATTASRASRSPTCTTSAP